MRRQPSPPPRQLMEPNWWQVQDFVVVLTPLPQARLRLRRILERHGRAPAWILARGTPLPLRRMAADSWRRFTAGRFMSRLIRARLGLRPALLSRTGFRSVLLRTAQDWSQRKELGFLFPALVLADRFTPRPMLDLPGRRIMCPMRLPSPFRPMEASWWRRRMAEAFG